MSRLVVYLIIITLITGCLNRQQEKKDIIREGMLLVNDRDILRDDLAGKLEHFTRMISKHSDADSIKGICYTVAFYNEGLNTLITAKDTAIILSYYSHGVDTVGYRGVLWIDDYPVAVMDKDNIGLMFYDENALIRVPLTSFNCIKYRVRSLMRLLKLEYGELKNVFKEMDNEY